MDLAKIIGILKLELQTLNAAIASLESLDRAHKVSASVPRRAVAAIDRTTGESAPAKRPRGRPRKYPLPAASSSSNNDSESSVA